MSRSASRRPAEERTSASDCTDQVATPPVAVSRVKVASCPQLVRETQIITRSGQILHRDMSLRSNALTCCLRKGLNRFIEPFEPSCRRFVVVTFRILPHSTGNLQCRARQCSKCADISPSRLEDYGEDLQSRPHWRLWSSLRQSLDYLVEGTAIQSSLEKTQQIRRFVFQYLLVHRPDARR